MLSLLLFSYSACTDQGCIEADNFGEYEQEMIIVNANALNESCDYASEKPLDSTQGSGLVECLTTGRISITDESNTTAIAKKGGCSGFTDAQITFRNLCIEQCRQNCFSANASSSTNAEPDWILTSQKQDGKNIGITLTPGAKIYIRAIGTVVLGGAKLNPIFAVPTEYRAQTKDKDFKNFFVDVKAGGSKEVKFSGKWTDGAGKKFGGDIDSNTPDEKEKTLNGAIRTVAYLIPHPAGYGFDTSASSELDGTKGTPLFADTRLWDCSYAATGKDLTKQSSCNSLPYNTSSGYPNTDDAIAQGLYSISSLTKAANLGTVGGMIRWDNDGLEALNTDPFINTTCNSSGCSNPSDTVVENIIGDLTSTKTITNNNNYALRLRFKNLSSDDSGVCNLSGANGTSLKAKIKDQNGAELGSDQYIAVNKSGWSTDYIALEPKEKIEIQSNTANYTNSSGTTNCGKVIAYRFDKLQDIAIQKSGFVSFSILGTSLSSGQCKLTARIINPNGIREDFYEYDSFETSQSADPINNLGNIPFSNRSIGAAGFNKNWSNKVFVRKGQVIRFDPASWNGSWITESGNRTRQCGIGMAIKVGGIDMETGQIDDRPAILCRGTQPELIPNPLCTLEPVPGTTNGDTRCWADTKYCNSISTNPASYCPSPDCQQKPFPGTCIITAGVTRDTCDQCIIWKNFFSGQDKKISIPLDQCYDLENYTGKVSNIPDNGFTDDMLKNTSIAKGAIKLEEFNGSYGNFQNFTKTADVEPSSYGSNKIYHLNQPLFFGSDGRLNFLIIDNNSFLPSAFSSYANNSSGSSYSGSNGYKIDLSGQQEAKNGQWLEAVICQSSDTGGCTNSLSRPVQLADQPRVITIDDPSKAGQEPKITSYYQFDPFGSITRIGNTNAGPPPGANGDTNSENPIGNNFYRHSYGYTASIDPETVKNAKATVSTLRLAFKIKDSDVPDCKRENPSLNESCVDANGINSCDGIVVNNGFYNASISTNVSAICSKDKSPGGSETDNCQKQYFCANKYYNNSGQYQVVVRVENKGSTLSDIVDQVVSPVIEMMDGKPDGSTMGQAEIVYKQVVNDPRFQAIVQLMVVMMISFYGVGYLMGVSEFTQTEIIIRIIKIGVIYLFIDPHGWEWFEKIFVGLFKHGVDYITFLMASSFDKSVDLQNAIANNDFSNKSILFGGIDKVFGMFFSREVQSKIFALFFASIFGPIYLYIIYLSFFLYVYSVANAVLLYLTAQVFISIIFVLGPIFFLTLLFNQTKDMFDRWLAELISFSLQQIFLLTTLSFFNIMMYEIVKMSLGYKICWGDVWVINLNFTQIKLLSFWTVASMPPSMSLQSGGGNVSAGDGIPSIFCILFIWVVASLMEKFIAFMTNLGATIGGGVKASELSAGLKDAAKSVGKGLYDMAPGKIVKAIEGGVDRADDYLFDTGKEADKKRAAASENATADRKNRNAMRQAGDAADSKFRVDNAKKIAAAQNNPDDKKQLAQEMKENRNKAMEKVAIAAGVSDPKDIKRLINEGPGMPVGDTLGEMAFNAVRDRARLPGGVKELSLELSANEKRLQRVKPFEKSEEEQIAKKEKEDLRAGDGSGKSGKITKQQARLNAAPGEKISDATRHDKYYQELEAQEQDPATKKDPIKMKAIQREKGKLDKKRYNDDGNERRITLRGRLGSKRRDIAKDYPEPPSASAAGGSAPSAPPPITPRPAAEGDGAGGAAAPAAPPSAFDPAAGDGGDAKHAAAPRRKGPEVTASNRKAASKAYKAIKEKSDKKAAEESLAGLIAIGGGDNNENEMAIEQFSPLAASPTNNASPTIPPRPAAPKRPEAPEVQKALDGLKEIEGDD